MREEEISGIAESVLGLDLDGDGVLETELIDIKVKFVKKYESTAGELLLQILSTAQF